jgi:hypothetical protein
LSRGRAPASLHFAQLAACFLLAGAVGCISVGPESEPTGVGSGDILPGAFVVSGTMVKADFARACLLFEAENGVQYHLVNEGDVSTDAFEEITQEGTSSTLEVVLRRDLDERCQVDDLSQVLEVTNILEVTLP